MKRANLIIEHIKRLPQFEVMNQYYCCKRFVSLLNPRLQIGIAYSYLRDDKLFLALSHPGYKMELNSKIDFLKSFLSEVRDVDEKCKNFKASKIVIVNSKLRSVRERDEGSISSAIHYPERAKGNFEINSDDDDLRLLFERIRVGILKKVK